MSSSEFSPNRLLALELVEHAHPSVLEQLRALDLYKAMRALASLLLQPAMASSCLRVTVLLHLALRHCRGELPLTSEVIQRLFTELGTGMCGAAEDPGEDLFTTLVSTTTGTFRILQGIRESPGFHLQRILNVVDSMSAEYPLQAIEKSIHALLSLSQGLLIRNGLVEHMLGAPHPAISIPDDILNSITDESRRLDFSFEELNNLAIEPGDLDEFILLHPDHIRLDNAAQLDIGHSELERRPLFCDPSGILVVLPTAFATAITRYVIETIQSMGLAEAFEYSFTQECILTIGAMPMFTHLKPNSLRIYRHADASSVLLAWPLDQSRWCALYVIIDGLAGFHNKGLAGANADPNAVGQRLTEGSTRLIRIALQRGAKEGLLLVVVAGLGRTVRFPFRKDTPEGWFAEVISLADFATLSHMERFDEAGLWKLIRLKNEVQKRHVSIININGLLNLAAWVDELDGEIVQHRPGPPPRGGTEEGIVVVRQNALRNARYAVARESHERRVLDSSGTQVLVKRIKSGLFDCGDENAPFMSVRDLQKDVLRSVQLGKNRPWWLRITATEQSDSGAIFHYWEMLCTWLRRTVPILEDIYALPTSPVEYFFEFAQLDRSYSLSTDGSMGTEELRRLISITTNKERSSIRIEVQQEFQCAFNRPEHTAERLLVEAMVRGVAALCGRHSEMEIERATASICFAADARFIHSFNAQDIRDSLLSGRSQNPIVISELDAALCRLGLGWRVQNPSAGFEITGLKPCTELLNNAVSVLIEDIREELRRYAREPVLRKLILNYELAACDKRRWMRTGRAQFALALNKQAAKKAMLDRAAELNAAQLSCRILIEAAICECPEERKAVMTDIDLSFLMAKASMAFHLAGESDAIYWGTVEPRVGITPLGDIQTHKEFHDSIYTPFGKVGREPQYQEAADRYEGLYGLSSDERTAPILKADLFSPAFNEEFGISLPDLGKFLNELDSIALEKSESILTLRMSDLFTLARKATQADPDELVRFFRTVTLVPRPRWDSAPEGFCAKDWQPWRFGRRLSVIRRPLLQFATGEDPEYLVCPAMVRESIVHTTMSFKSGEIPSWQTCSKKMKTWLGTANHHNGLAFNGEVADGLNGLGWQTQLEVKITKLMGRSFDRDYGDVDVIAWSNDSARVLIIEWKDLQYKKTVGEVSEQLADYRGELRRDGKRDDLKKHLDRVSVVSADPNRLRRYLKLAGTPTIESHLVFRNPVPMKFALERIRSKVRVSLFADLPRLAG